MEWVVKAEEGQGQVRQSLAICMQVKVKGQVKRQSRAEQAYLPTMVTTRSGKTTGAEPAGTMPDAHGALRRMRLPGERVWEK